MSYRNVSYRRKIEVEELSCNPEDTLAQLLELKKVFSNCRLIVMPISVLYSLAFTTNHGARNPLDEQRVDNVTQLLIEVSKGDREAVDLLLPVIYDELRKLAANYLRRERPDHTLQPTALVHEAYLRLVNKTRANWQNRAHFFGVAAQIMRRLLVDHARKHNAEKRGQHFQKLSLDENVDRAVERGADAFRWLTQAEREHAVGFTFVRVDPRSEGLRSDWRFRELICVTDRTIP
jgi:RNA polymerase sigma factor (TIGR02999 family)